MNEEHYFYGCSVRPGGNFVGVMEQNFKKKEPRVQLGAAVAVTVAGCCLLIAGFIVAPAGEIHQSVLIGFGECLTFAGSLLGIDYRYRR